MLDVEAAALLEQALGSAPAEYAVNPLTAGESGSRVARVSGSLAGGEPFSVVLKSRSGNTAHASLWYCDDPGLLDREVYVYELLEQQDLPRARVLAQAYADPSSWTLVLEDLSRNYRLLSRDYEFTPADRRSIVDTYALIHARTIGMTGPIIDRLQSEEGSQITADTGAEVFDVITSTLPEITGMTPRDFGECVAAFIHLRTRMSSEPRCLTYNDFFQTNVALPADETGCAVLLDWELAGFGLPQFDALNAGFSEGEHLEYYFRRMSGLGQDPDPAHFASVLDYARLSGVLQILWLLHLKLKADPNGRLPSWMEGVSRGALSGGLATLARKAAR